MKSTLSDSAASVSGSTSSAGTGMVSKTDDSNNPSTRSALRPIRLSGFYTEENRGPSGDRIGFDIISYIMQHTKSYNDDDGVTIAAEEEKGNCHCPLSIESRDSLSRSASKIKKGDPSVGKYLVKIDNVNRLAVSSLTQMADRLKKLMSQKSPSECTEEGINTTSTNTNNILEVCVLDEVGKMEMLCPSFIPAVHDILDTISRYNNVINDGCNNSKNEKTSYSEKCILFGTIPTPRYGRVIPEVESIRSRDDVLVLHVTKQNREELRDRLISLLHSVIDEGEVGGMSDWNLTLQEYVYDRPLGSGSISKPNVEKIFSTNDSTATHFQYGKHETNHGVLTPCGPLVDDNLSPKVLILGRTASPKPRDESLSYSERSMWNVLGRIFNIPFSPVKNVDNITPHESENYRALVKTTLDHGICIWDVLSNVHLKQSNQKLRRGKRKASTNNDTTYQPPQKNDIQSLIQRHQSITTICFIGAKAYSEFLKRFEKSRDVQNLELCVLPSSSPTNSRITLVEKVAQWKSAFSKAGVAA